MRTVRSSSLKCLSRGLPTTFFFQAEDGIRDYKVTGVQTCALPISRSASRRRPATRPGRASSGTRARAPLGGGALEVGEDPRVVRGQLAVDPLVVERLEETLGGLAQRGRFPNQHGDRLTPAALTQERGTEGLVALARQARIVFPEPRAILAERLLDGLAFGR